MQDDRRMRAARRLTAALATLVVLGGCARSGPAPLVLEEKFTKWARYEAEPGATHFSALDQIDLSNVGQLEVAWSYAGGAAGFNPIVIDTMMYVFARGGDALAAVHAATGRELWVHTPEGPGGVGRRGVMYWESDDRSDRRLYITRNNFVHAIDAMTGRPIPSFGVDGKADLRQGITSRPHESIIATPSSPGTVWEDVLIFGSGPGEAYTAGPGDIRAFDAVTGEFLWVFHTIPHPGEFGYDTWPEDAWTRVGGTNAWGGLSVDEERGIVYAPLGSASYDFYGADRLGDNLFANSLIALDIRTGKRLWHYQTVHHDLWDYDLTATPTLLTVQHEGKPVDVVALAAKTGFLFVFDRVTGEPLWPIEERPVPPSDMPGEVAAATQPHPTWPLPFAVQSFGMDEVNPYLSPAEQDSVRKRLGEILNLEETLFQPPSTRPTMQMPGNSGGANWGSTAGDPRDGSFYVVTKNLPTVLQLERILPGVFGTGTTQADRGQFTYQQNCQACHQADLRGTPPMIPALVGVTDRLTPEQIRTVVHDGRGNMPAFRDLSNQEIGALVTYLTNPALASPPAPAGQQASGQGAVPGGEDSGPLRYQTGYGYFSVSGGMYARKPPFTTMTKYDLNTGEIAWQIPVGEVPSLVERGITDDTGGSSISGGPAVTAGGLVFLMTQDRLRAYDQADGREVWSAELPGGGSGIPAVYEVGGRQYVVVSASRGGGFGPQAAPPVHTYVAYALPASVAAR